MHLSLILRRNVNVDRAAGNQIYHQQTRGPPLRSNIWFCRVDAVSGLPWEVARHPYRTRSKVRPAIEFASFSTQKVAEAFRVCRWKTVPAETLSAQQFRRKQLAEAVDFIERTMFQRNHRPRTNLQRQPRNHRRQPSSIDRAMITTQNVAKRIHVADLKMLHCDLRPRIPRAQQSTAQL